MIKIVQDRIKQRQDRELQIKRESYRSQQNTRVGIDKLDEQASSALMRR